MGFRHHPRALLGSALSAVVAQGSRRSLLAGPVQNGTISYTSGSSTATITSVDTANALLFFGGQSNADVNPDFQVSYGRLDLTNTTTVTAVGFNDGQTKVASYSVVPYVPGVFRSIQRGTIGLTGGATSNTATIATVDTTKTAIMSVGSSASSGANETEENWTHRVVLTNATTATATRAGSSASASLTTTYQVPEHF